MKCGARFFCIEDDNPALMAQNLMNLFSLINISRYVYRLPRRNEQGGEGGCGPIFHRGLVFKHGAEGGEGTNRDLGGRCNTWPEQYCNTAILLQLRSNISRK